MRWRRVMLLVAALWWGSLTGLGAWVVPLLFAHAPSKAVAAGLAAHLFSAQAWVGLACGLSSLWVAQRVARLQARTDAPSLWVVAALLCTAILEWGIAPRILARDNLVLWHGLGTSAWLLQWVCVTVHSWQLGSETQASAPH
ncbi:MAG: DUF4149 domain-containing protein [Betaproteobacteria bacterium]|nr:DUF4149 domain-containing protein [Betaproteobacteria bacterium]NBY05176.1 DUF4149 domain-containing protein [Betaproteobacteria bacterium]